MSKIKRFCLFSLSVFLFAFSFLLPFKDLTKVRKVSDTTSASDVYVQLNAGIYSFNRSSDFVDLPTSIITLNNLDFNFYSASLGAWVNANRMTYNYSTNSLGFGLSENNTLLHSSSIISSGSFQSYNAWTRYFILNVSVQVPLSFYTFINSNTTYSTNNNRLSTLTIKNLGFDLVTGINYQLINVSSANTKLRYYFSKTNDVSYFAEKSFYFVGSDFTNLTINETTNSYYISVDFTSGLFFTDLYMVAKNRDYYFKTLANSLMPYLHSYTAIPFQFNIVGQTDTYTAVNFADNKISYYSTSDYYLATYSSSGVSSFEWVAENYDALAIHIIAFTDLWSRDVKFLYDNFVILTDYEISVIENKNKALEMLRENYSFFSMFSAMFDSCLITFKSLFNYSFFGVNLFSFMCALLTLSLIFFVFRLLKGGKE